MTFEIEHEVSIMNGMKLQFHGVLSSCFMKDGFEKKF